MAGCAEQNSTEDRKKPSLQPDGADRPISSESARASIEQGFELLGQGNTSAAQEVATKALLLDPNHGQAKILAAEVAFATNQFDEGIELLMSAAESMPRQSIGLKTRAIGMLWERGELDRAQAGFIRLLREHPNYDEGRRGLARLLNQRGFRFDANQQIRVLCRRPSQQPTIDELRCLIVPGRAYHDFAEKPDIDDQALIASVGELSVARALYSEGDVRLALNVLENGALLRRSNPAAVAFYGQVLSDAQLFERLGVWVASTDEKARRYPGYWIAMGGWAMKQRMPAQAVRIFCEAILREPGDLTAYDRLHLALKANGNMELADQVSRRRIAISTLIKLMRAIYSDPRADPESFHQMSTMLDEIGRPFEAKCWRSLALHRMGQSIQATQQSNSELTKLLSGFDPNQSQTSLLCGIDLELYPFDLDALVAKSGAHRSSDDQREGDQVPAATPPAGQPVFVNVAPAVDLNFTYVNADPPKERYFRVHEALGSGIACLDFDLDGLVDIYAGQGACNPPDGRGNQPNMLARCQGDRFEIVTESAGCDDRGYTLGITSGDWNQDGFPDLVVGDMLRNHLFINQGDGTFRRLQQCSGYQPDPVWNQGKYTSSLAIADVTGDNLPDIVEVNYLDDDRIFEPLRFDQQGIPVRYPGPLHFRASVDRLFVGTGSGQLRGQLLDTPAPGLGLLIANIDQMGGNEIFVANDMKANCLWVRSEDTSTPMVQFEDLAVVRGVAFGHDGGALACMGIAAGDFDENGLLDLHVTNLFDQWANQYMQYQNHLFDDLTLPFQLDESTHAMLGFGTEVIDFDNNGTLDLVTGNGNVDDQTHKNIPFEMPTQVFVGDRTSLKQVTVAGDDRYWGANHLTRALVTLDWNNDGRLDFVAGDLKEPMVLMENRCPTDGNWIQFRLVGTRSERDAIGSSIRITTSDARQVVLDVKTGDGYMCRNQALLAAGLGRADHLRHAEIRWADGSRQSIGPLLANKRWLIVQDHSPFEENLLAD